MSRIDHATMRGILYTDQYQLTMAQAYWAQGMTECRAAFHLLFRRAPFEGWAAIACGIETVVELLDRWRLESEDLEFLAGLVGADGQPLFRKAFLDWLEGVRFRGDVWAVKEGTWVLPGTPLLRVEAAIVEAEVSEDAVHHRALVVVVVDEEAPTEPRGLVVSAQELRAGGVERGYPHAFVFADLRFDALLHLLRRFVGKRNCQYRIGAYPFFFDQVSRAHG